MHPIVITLAPYCYLTLNGNNGYDLSVVVPHGAGFTVVFPSAVDNSDYAQTETLKIEYSIATSGATDLYTSKIYTNVFAQATAAKKIVKVLGTFDTRTYFTIQENDDATDTLAMTGDVAKNCPHIYLLHILAKGTDNPKGLIPFDGKDFGATPENIVVSGDDLTDTITIANAATVAVKMLPALDLRALNTSGGDPGVITLNGGGKKAKTKRKNHNTQPGTRFRMKSAPKNP